MQISGQIIATENTSFHTKWWFSEVNLVPLISGETIRWVKYYSIWPEIYRYTKKVVFQVVVDIFAHLGSFGTPDFLLERTVTTTYKKIMPFYCCQIWFSKGNTPKLPLNSGLGMIGFDSFTCKVILD